MPVKDPIGDRMKGQYENRSRFYLVRRSYTIVRVDGKSFHTWTRGLQRPYSVELMKAMDKAAGSTLSEVMGCKLAYGQSDEYSFLLTDFDKIETQAWFDGSLQKIASVAASLFTGFFNRAAQEEGLGAQLILRGPAFFDARAFQIPDYEEVLNYFVWRQKDAERNSLSMLAQCHFSHKQLHGKKSADLHEMLHTKGVNWAKENDGFKRGRVVVRGDLTVWEAIAAPIFTRNRDWFEPIVPQHHKVHAATA